MIRHALLVVLLASAALSIPAQASEVFGQPLQGLPTASLAEVLAKPEAGKRVRLEGTIEKVCQSKGCWLALKQGEQSVHVTFAAYAFFVPKDSAGRPVVLEGKVVVKEPKPTKSRTFRARAPGRPRPRG